MHYRTLCHITDLSVGVPLARTRIPRLGARSSARRGGRSLSLKLGVGGRSPGLECAAASVHLCTVRQFSSVRPPLTARDRPPDDVPVRPHHILGRSASTRLGRSASSYSQPFGLNIFSAVRPHLISGPSAFCTRLHKHLRKSRSPGLISWPFNLRTVVQPRALDLSALVSSRQSGITLTKFGITRPFGLKASTLGRPASTHSRSFDLNCRPAIWPPRYDYISTTRPFGLRYLAKFGIQHVVIRPQLPAIPTPLPEASKSAGPFGLIDRPFGPASNSARPYGSKSARPTDLNMHSSIRPHIAFGHQDLTLGRPATACTRPFGLPLIWTFDLTSALREQPFSSEHVEPTGPPYKISTNGNQEKAYTEEKDAYFSSNEYIFFRAASHGRWGSSMNVDTRFSNFIKSRYSKAASLSASAFPSDQSKCLRTARSSTLHNE
ncbi:hypothetical protein LR48_Vigan03g098800 [Vigna angularis]|uniref:Uncharacterized protein n=1 Tax=Phaseolus angularis TaxID=3914 RepID=A0A0L9U4A5_PHAAN|nr:hypothetical protein LR48_Vigan03g098800 [Vigna angularis]